MPGNNRFYSSLSLLLLLNVLIKPLWIFAIDRQVQVLAGNETYGHYFSLLNLSLVFSFAADMGLTPFLNRRLAISPTGSEALLPFIKLKAVFSIIYVALVTGTAVLTGIQQWDILLYVTAIQLLTSLFVFLRAVITARQQFKTDAWLSVADKTIMLLVGGSFLYLPFAGHTLPVDRFLQIQLLSTLLACLLATVAILKYRKKENTSPALMQRTLWYDLWPFALAVLLMSTHNRLDGFLLEQLHRDGAREAGIYAGAYRLLDVCNMAGYLVISFLFPYIAKRWSRQENIADVVLQSRHLLISFAVVVVAILVGLAPWVQQVLYKQPDAYAATVLQWCIPSLIGYSLINIYGTVLSATGHIRLFLYLMMGAVLINTLLNLWLIPQWGARGAAVAALLTQTALGCILMTTAVYTNGLRTDMRSIAWYAATGALASVCLLAGLHFSVNKGLLLSVTTLLIAVLLFASGIVSVKSLQGLINKNQTE